MPLPEFFSASHPQLLKIKKLQYFFIAAFYKMDCMVI
jgi:hypothetical protein